MTIALVHTSVLDGLISMRSEQTQSTPSTLGMPSKSGSRAPGKSTLAIDADMFTYHGQSVDSAGWRREMGSPFHDVIDAALRALSNGLKLASNGRTGAEIESIYRTERTRESSKKQHRVIML